jgi:hypothetical protein
MTYKFNRKYFTEEKITKYINQQNNTVVLVITSLKTGQISMGPSWMVYYDGKFYFPGQRGTLKSKLIEEGNVSCGVTVVDPKYFPQVKKGEIPYVTVIGEAKVYYPGEFNYYPEILKLYFLKYEDVSVEEAQEIAEKVGKESKTSALIELTPKKNFILEALEREEANKEGL